MMMGIGSGPLGRRSVILSDHTNVIFIVNLWEENAFDLYSKSRAKRTRRMGGC